MIMFIHYLEDISLVIQYFICLTVQSRLKDIVALVVWNGQKSLMVAPEPLGLADLRPTSTTGSAGTTSVVLEIF